MCTAVTYQTKAFYFGRTLDYEFSYGEEVTITPRKYPFTFRNAKPLASHYALIGMAHVAQNYPLYYDAINEKGVGMAGLHFVGNAVYKEAAKNKSSIAAFEFIPWILCQCDSVQAAKRLLKPLQLTGEAFSRELPAAELHWIIADRKESITVEAVKEGLRIYQNPVGILTNNPPFDIQMFLLNNYMQLSAKPPQNHFSDTLDLRPYSRGMGAIGLPGDLSSQSRFVRAAFVKLHSVSTGSEVESVSQFFHILGAVEQQRGCCDVGDGALEMTIYTSCCNADKGIYYYTTYNNRQITAVDMYREDLESNALIRYALISEEQIKLQNAAFMPFHNK